MPALAVARREPPPDDDGGGDALDQLAVARGDDDLLLLLDTWLLDAKSDGMMDELYNYWVLGEVKRTQPPRWSIVRDVLGWVD
jgi:ABC-type amino acid transport substrate-binding protein